MTPQLAFSDRNTWCTPKWITDALGEFTLDPCSNDRSTVQARETYQLGRGQDGLELAAAVPACWRVFVNPPYEGGAVVRWVRAYQHTRFCFLLRLDPSTKWFAELYARTQLILVPRGNRIQFEPPPGVKASSNPFPHALFYAWAADATPAIRARCYEWYVAPSGDAPPRIEQMPEEP